nr:MAG TPA: hypothetical protein [Microviridae sp.]
MTGINFSRFIWFVFLKSLYLPSNQLKLLQWHVCTL